MIAKSQHAGSKGPRAGLSSVQLVELMEGLRTHAGIKIETPKAVIELHLRERMELLGVADIPQYLAMLDGSISARAEWLALSDLLSVKETRFFRQNSAMECVADHIQALLSADPTLKNVSLWSAGCSTGQELYSMGMVIEHLLRQYQPTLEWQGFGTDISFKTIEIAQKADYSDSAIKFVPEKYKRPYLQENDEGLWRVSESIRERSSFFQNNLMYMDGFLFSDFDVIFCQNVLIYFEREQQQWIIDQFVERLSPGGLLVLGAGEDVKWKNKKMRRESCPGVCAYKKIGGNS